MLTWKEYKNNYLKSHSDFVACSVENWQFLERAYDDYVEQQEITILKKENELLKERIEIKNGIIEALKLVIKIKERKPIKHPYLK